MSIRYRHFTSALVLSGTLVLLGPGAHAQHRGFDFHGRDFGHFAPHERDVWRGGHWVHDWHDGRFGWWWLAGGSWYFYPQPVYPYPTYVPPAVVVQQAPPAPAGLPPAQSWYYCDNPQGYYPYVASCNGAWREVPTAPPRHLERGHPVRKAICAVLASALLAGCATQPMGPSVAVMPGPDKPFAVFERDQAVCKQYADAQVGGAAASANDSALGSAALGTVLGAGLGAALLGGRGAAIGAGMGAIGGTAVGTNNSQRAGMSLQERYDIAYEQCMYAKGNQVPGYQAALAPPPPPPALR